MNISEAGQGPQGRKEGRKRPMRRKAISSSVSSRGAEVSWSSRDIDFKRCRLVSLKMWDTVGHSQSPHSPHMSPYSWKSQ